MNNLKTEPTGLYMFSFLFVYLYYGKLVGALKSLSESTKYSEPKIATRSAFDLPLGNNFLDHYPLPSIHSIEVDLLIYFWKIESSHFNCKLPVMCTGTKAPKREQLYFRRLGFSSLIPFLV